MVFNELDAQADRMGYAFCCKAARMDFFQDKQSPSLESLSEQSKEADMGSSAMKDTPDI